ncbi:MAG: hypothetical protein EOP04_01925 [Proteobacteria bacterium]|nr:MAG: hypothetical protein EOP04_01925 [Pseudomonadota bacterium]
MSSISFRTKLSLNVLGVLLTISAPTKSFSEAAGQIKPPASTPVLVLPVNVFNEFKNDFDKLFYNWLGKNSERGFYRFQNRTDLQKAMNDVMNGFAKFCSARRGSFKPLPEDHGLASDCVVGNNHIGKINIASYAEGGLFFIGIRSFSPHPTDPTRYYYGPYDDARKRNGPTGTIVTNEGTFRFARFGNRLVSFNGAVSTVILEDQKPLDQTKLERMDKIKKLDFDESCCGMTVTETSGNVKKVTNKSLISWMFNSPIFYINLRIVLVDPKTGQYVNRIFPSFKGVKSIEIDPVEKWLTLPNIPLPTSFKVDSPENMKKIIAENNSLIEVKFNEVQSKEWASKILKGKLPDQSMSELIEKVRSMSSEANCNETPIDAIADINSAIMCKQVEFEARLLGTQNLTINKNFPLTKIALLSIFDKKLENCKSQKLAISSGEIACVP